MNVFKYRVQPWASRSSREGGNDAVMAVNEITILSH